MYLITKNSNFHIRYWTSLTPVQIIFFFLYECFWLKKKKISNTYTVIHSPPVPSQLAHLRIWVMDANPFSNNEKAALQPQAALVLLWSTIAAVTQPQQTWSSECLFYMFFNFKQRDFWLCFFVSYFIKKTELRIWHFRTSCRAKEV